VTVRGPTFASGSRGFDRVASGSRLPGAGHLGVLRAEIMGAGAGAQPPAGDASSWFGALSNVRKFRNSVCYWYEPGSRHLERLLILRPAGAGRRALSD
jgi:hypothetical protein